MDLLWLNGVLCVYSWTTGLRVAQRVFRIITEDDVMAYCMWLERHGRPEDAECVLDTYCSRK
jgi:hypothetical protein